MPTRYWCTYCDVGLIGDEQRAAHEDCGHITREIEYLRPEDDRRYQQFTEADG